MDNYVVYFIIGKVSTDRERLSSWTQWQQCLRLLDELFLPYKKTARIKSHQVYETPLSGTARVSYKKVPGLGALKWNFEDHKKWSDYCNAAVNSHAVQHRETTIVSSTGTETPDICMFLDDHIPAGIDDYLYNQCITLSIRERLHEALPVAYRDNLIAHVIKLANAVRAGKTIRPWEIIKNTVDPASNRSSRWESALSFPHFVKKPIPMSLEFSDFFQTWSYIE